LNKHYKKENLPTNVLAFEGNLEEEKSLGVQPPFLGDVVICFPVVEKEAMDQKKTFDRHFAHMLVHGFLHLLGFDHQNDKDQKIMQELENEALTNFMLQKMDQPYNIFELK
jgi:probable rRNA maturation factor